MRLYLQHTLSILLCLALLGSEVMGGVAIVSSARNIENCDSVCQENEVSKPEVETTDETPACCRMKKEMAVSKDTLKLLEYVDFAEVEFAEVGTCRKCPCCIPTSPSRNDIPRPLPENNESVAQILQQGELTSPSVLLSARFSNFVTRELSASPAIPLTDSALLCVWLT